MRGSMHHVGGLIHTISPNAYPGSVDTASSSSSVSFKKRSVSGRILAETHGNGDLEEDFEAAHLLEQTKKLKITTVPGAIPILFLISIFHRGINFCSTQYNKLSR